MSTYMAKKARLSASGTSLMLLASHSVELLLRLLFSSEESTRLHSHHTLIAATTLSSSTVRMLSSQVRNSSRKSGTVIQVMLAT